MTDFEALFTLLADSGAEYVVVGGVAAVLHGSTRMTQDVDLVYRRTTENHRRLVEALDPTHPYPRGAPSGLPFDWSVETLERGLNFPLTTDVGFVDLFGEVVGGGTYDDLESRSDTFEIYGSAVRVVSLETLIELKRAAGRPKDYEIIAELEALREERGNGCYTPAAITPVPCPGPLNAIAIRHPVEWTHHRGRGKYSQAHRRGPPSPRHSSD